MAIKHLDDTWISEDGDDVLGVQVSTEDDGGLSIYLNVAEFVREDPLEARLRTSIVTAVSAVPGVESVTQEDRETWLVAGPASGDAVILALATVLVELEDELTAYVAEHS
ncbi:MAG: hypothetical protein LH468_09455 [Nocardioides sp.]|nr:hypothetical protein [Nocardioides sp.]